MRRAFAISIAAIVLAAGLGVGAAPALAKKPPVLAHINHLVVIYLENHSFDNLYGLFPGADGLAQATPADTIQKNLNGVPYTCLPQVDPNLTSVGCIPNAPFDIDQYVPANQKTVDLVHRYYQNQVQMDGGWNDRFTAVSDAKGLTQGYYDTSTLPLAAEASRYVLADHFFQAAFGGSFLNHQWLIAAATPVFAGAPRDGSSCDQHTVLGANGLPVAGKDGALTTVAQGDDAINTIMPWYAPYRAGTPDCKRLPPLTNTTIGDELSAAGISWAWYSGGWNAAEAGTPEPLFQYHHQPFNYFAAYAPGTAARAAHLKDETDFLAAAQSGTLPAVSFVKPLGPDNEHPGYATLLEGEQHTLDLVNAVRNGPNWKDTAIVITYDENGGFWDHVAPPAVDQWGPGTRVPTLIISPWAQKGFVDHTVYDTTSILATIERRWDLPALGTRDANATDLRAAFRG